MKPALIAPRLLVIDDEEMMCSMLEATLAGNFDVIACLDSRRAFERLLSENFDAILCDLMMPHFSGMELHRELLKRRPTLAERILFMTGGTFTSDAQRFLAEPGRLSIQKPFKLTDLVLKLKTMLEGQSDPDSV